MLPNLGEHDVDQVHVGADFQIPLCIQTKFGRHEVCSKDKTTKSTWRSTEVAFALYTQLSRGSNLGISQIFQRSKQKFLYLVQSISFLAGSTKS